MSQRDPEEILKILEDQALEDEIRDVAAMSDKDLQAEMRAAGVDPKRVRAAGRRMAARAMGSNEEPPSSGEAWVSAPPRAPRRSLDTRWAVLLAATLSAAVAGGTMYAVGRLNHHEETPIVVSVDGSPERGAKTSAERIRQRALDACDRAAWQECLDGLTAARALDPQGDVDPRVQKARDRARQGVEPPEPTGAVPGRDIKDRRPPPRDLK